MFGKLIVKTCAILGLTICCIVHARIEFDDDDILCDIDANISCQAGMCCVRNESSFDYMSCQHQGGDGDLCANYTSQFICPCKHGYFCKTNSDDIFGTCKEKVVDIPCNMSARVDSCPKGLCCVNDEFLFTYTYCKPFGVEGSNCVTHDSFFECPCNDGLHCQSNLDGVHVSSVFGTCKHNPPPVG